MGRPKNPSAGANGPALPIASWTHWPDYKSLEGALGAAWRESARTGDQWCVVMRADATRYEIRCESDPPAATEMLVAQLRAVGHLET